MQVFDCSAVDIINLSDASKGNIVHDDFHERIHSRQEYQINGLTQEGCHKLVLAYDESKKNVMPLEFIGIET